jgi:hypothetical protein
VDRDEQGRVLLDPDGRARWVAKRRVIRPGYRSGVGRDDDGRSAADGILAAGMVEVLQGLRPGEWIVRRGAEALEDGTPIKFPENVPER